MQPADLQLAPDLPHKKTRKRIFLEQMDIVVPWAELTGGPHCTVLPRRAHRAPTLSSGDHAARAFHAAVVRAV